MKSLLLFICLFLSLLSSGQTLRFNKINHGIGGMPGSSLLLEDSTMVVISGSILDWRRVDYSRYNLNGNLNANVFYLDSTIASARNCSKCLLKYDNFMLYAQTNFIRQDSGYVQVQILDSTFQELKKYKHIQFQYAIPTVDALTKDSDSSFIVAGHLYRNVVGVANKYDLWVARFDTAFNVLWEKRFPDTRPSLNGGYFGTDIVLDQYGALLITGWGYGSNNATQTFLKYSVAARLNRQDGQLHWLKEFHGPAAADGMYALDEGNGTYRFAEVQWLSLYPRTNIADSVQLHFGLIDTLGNIIQDTSMGRMHGRYVIKDLQRTLDGNYYVVGARDLLPAPNKNGSAAFKISPQGEALWYRNYFHGDSTDYSHIWSFLPTPDSGFIHVGLHIDNENAQLGNFNWLLKTDKYGCAVAGCQNISLHEQPLNLYEITAYPNPGSGIVHLNRNTGINETLVLEVYNLQGQKVLQQYWYDGSHTTINLSQLPRGTYLLNISGKEFQQIKLSVQ